MFKLRWSRWRRWWTSASSVIAGGLSIAVLIEIGKNLGFLGGPEARGVVGSEGTGVRLLAGFWWIVGVGAVLLILRAYSEYLQRTYDPSLASKFDDQFVEDSMRQTRTLAAKTLKNFQGRLRSDDPALKDIDDVLDFFEQLGFYVKGDQVTPEVAHESFHYWIRGYYIAARDYIGYNQIAAPTAWEHIQYLYDVTSAVEKQEAKANSWKPLPMTN